MNTYDRKLLNMTATEREAHWRKCEARVLQGQYGDTGGKRAIALAVLGTFAIAVLVTVTYFGAC